MARIKWLVFLAVALFSVSASAEYYRYKDSDGNTVFTDDITRVPRAQQPLTQTYTEYKTETTRAPQKTPEAIDTSSAPEAVSQTLTGRQDGAAETAPDLEKREKDLALEYRTLMKEKDRLDSFRLHSDQKTADYYNEQVLDLNKRIDAYEKRKRIFNAEVDAHNDRVKKEIEALLEHERKKDSARQIKP